MGRGVGREVGGVCLGVGAGGFLSSMINIPLLERRFVIPQEAAVAVREAEAERKQV